MKKKTTAIVSLALATTIAATVAGCSAKEEKPEGIEVSSIISTEVEVTDEQGEVVTNASGEAVTEVVTETISQTTKEKSKKDKETTIKKKYIVTNIKGKPIEVTTTPAIGTPVTNKKGETVTDKNGSVVTSLPTEKPSTVVNTTVYKKENFDNVLPEDSFDGYYLTEFNALMNLSRRYPDMYINYYYDYDPNNDGSVAYFAEFSSKDNKEIIALITVDLTNGQATRKDLKTDKITKLDASY